MRLWLAIISAVFVGCSPIEPDGDPGNISPLDVAHLQPKSLDPSLIDSPIVLDGWLRRKQKGWPTQLECVGMDVILTFPAKTDNATLDSLNGKHVRIQGHLRSHSVPASSGQQGQSGNPHIRYYVQVSKYEVVPISDSGE